MFPLNFLPQGHQKSLCSCQIYVSTMFSVTSTAQCLVSKHFGSIAENCYVLVQHMNILKPIYFLRYEEHMNAIGILIYDKYLVATATRALNGNIKKP